MKITTKDIPILFSVCMVCLFMFPLVGTAQNTDKKIDREQVSQNELSSLIHLKVPSSGIPKFSFLFEETPFKDALKQVADKGRYKLLVNHSLFPEDHRISMRLDNVNLREAFERVLADTPLDFMIAGNGYIIIIPGLEGKKYQIQQETVTGQVTDASTGESLAGVNVVVKGTTIGTATDSEGNYELEVSSLQDTLIYSFIGYQTTEIPINGRTQIDVTLQPQAITGEELVVIGFGTQRRETITSAISKVTEEDFNTGQVTDPLELINGKVPGLIINNPNDGDPNATTDISLRGPVSLMGNSEPLVVIDGIPGGDLQAIAPSNIASIDVLKDGSAAAIYGSRAAGGVIMVTTKDGKPGEIGVTYNVSAGTSIPANKFELLNAEQFKQLSQEQGIPPLDEGVNTDWFDEITQMSTSQSHNLSIAGGSENTTYFASLDYRNFKGIDLEAERAFISGTARLNTKALNDKLDLAFRFTNSKDDRVLTNRGALGQSLRMFPTFPVKNPDGTFFEAPEVQFGLQWNPVANVRKNNNVREEQRVLASMSGTYTFLPSLEATLTYTFEKNEFTTSSFSDNDDFFQQRNGINGQAAKSETQIQDQNFKATVLYRTEIKNHSFDVLGGFSFNNLFEDGFSAGNNNFNSNAVSFNNLGAGSALNNLDPQANRNGVFVSSFASERTLKAGFGRITYDYQDRYLFSGSVRREGASVLGANNQWGTFFGLSVGWRLTNEAFMEDVNFIQNLKVRAGFGRTGNQRSVAVLQSLATIGEFGGGVQDGFFGEPGSGEFIQPFALNSNPNPDLKWEVKDEVNVGVEFSLFNDRLSGTFDYYNRKIKDLIGNFSAPQPPFIFPNITANAGKLESRGFEYALTAQLIGNHTLGWEVTAVGSYNKNEIETLSSKQFKGTAQDVTFVLEGVSTQRLAAGQSASAFFGRKFAGFTEDGAWLFENKEGEAVPNSEIGEEDFRFLGNSIPKYDFNLTNKFNFKNFDLTIFTKSAFGFQALNAKRLVLENRSRLGRNNLFKSALGEKGFSAPTIFSDFFLENGNYIKIKNITLGYNVPLGKSKVAQQINDLRVYFTATNVATLTGFSGDDPELNINFTPTQGEFGEGGTQTTPGPSVSQVFDFYPSTTGFELGVSLKF